ncbi:hypothetical protein ONZ45_g14569 [Pleurotus djamor]|nr:hypothetical protein ONZ45_g14569 [Pleurotus djamor]
MSWFGSSTYDNKLSPPIGTSWWRRQSFTLLNDKRFKTDANITWKVDAYIYTVNAQPNEDFESNGGLVYVILAHRGFCYQEAKEVSFYAKCPASKMELIKHFPDQDDHISTGSRRSYPIAFRQSMQMFKDNGNQGFSFDASYEDTLLLDNFKYTAYEDLGPGRHCWVVKNEASRAGARYKISALSVYELSSIGEVSFTFEFWIKGSSEGIAMEKEIKINAMFST